MTRDPTQTCLARWFLISCKPVFDKKTGLGEENAKSLQHTQYADAALEIIQTYGNVSNRNQDLLDAHI